MRREIASLRALTNGSRDPGKAYVINGDYCLYGCKITQGTSASDMYLALEGQASGDDAHENPYININPLRTEEYPNIALIYGDAFLSKDLNASDEAESSLLLDDAPGTADYGRYDIVYAYIGQAGPAVAILTGTAAAAVKTDFVANGLDGTVYPSTYDPILPRGTLPLARVYVQTGDTGIANARIADLRGFKSRSNPIPEDGKFLAHTGAGLGSTNTAVRKLSTIIQNNCPGITHSTSAADGYKFTATEPGLYDFEFCDIGQDASSYIGFSVNSAQLTTSIESADVADVGTRIVRSATSALNKHGGRLVATIRLDIGDFVVPHCTIGTYTGESNLTRISVKKSLEL